MDINNEYPNHEKCVQEGKSLLQKNHIEFEKNAHLRSICVGGFLSGLDIEGVGHVKASVPLPVTECAVENIKDIIEQDPNEKDGGVGSVVDSDVGSEVGRGCGIIVSDDVGRGFGCNVVGAVHGKDSGEVGYGGIGDGDTEGFGGSDSDGNGE